MNYRNLCGPDPRPMTVAEADTLREMIGQLPPNPIIVQIGAERGASTLAMLDARPDAFIFSIDCGARPEEFDNLKEANLPWWRVVRGLGRSQQIGREWPPTWECDALLIDGDHRRPGIDRDLELWPRFVKAGGLVILHDYIHPSVRAPSIIGRVWEAVQDWHTDQYPIITQTERLIVYRKRL